jgi:Methyltransferase domain
MDFRTKAIIRSLEYVSNIYSETSINLIEIGCMFKEDEGLSTYKMAEFIEKRPKGGKLISIEYNQENIKACKEIFNRLNRELINLVEFHHGHSLSVLPKVLDDLHYVHYFNLDGGAHPEVCINEFEMVKEFLAPEGVILIDDACSINPSRKYYLPRPLGKATLIFPMLIIENYLLNRKSFRNANSISDDAASIPNSKFINQLEALDLRWIGNNCFDIIGTHQKMLAYGSDRYISWISDIKDEKQSVSDLIKSKDLFNWFKAKWIQKK